MGLFILIYTSFVGFCVRWRAQVRSLGKKLELRTPILYRFTALYLNPVVPILLQLWTATLSYPQWNIPVPINSRQGRTSCCISWTCWGISEFGYSFTIRILVCATGYSSTHVPLHSYSFTAIELRPVAHSNSTGHSKNNTAVLVSNNTPTWMNSRRSSSYFTVYCEDVGHILTWFWKLLGSNKWRHRIHYATDYTEARHAPGLVEDYRKAAPLL